MRPVKKSLTACWLLLLPAACLLAAEGDLRLVEAAKKKDQRAVRSLLEQGVDVNARQTDGTTALMWAAHWDDLETADLLIRARANANAANDYGVTALSLACTNGSARMVAKLLQAGGNPNAALPRTGETPLMRCAWTGNAEAVRALLARGADAKVKEKRRGQTALMWAVEQNHVEAAQALLEKGADVRARSSNGFTPLLFAARNGNVEFAKLLLGAGADVNEATPEDGSALVVSSASGHAAFSIFLLGQGANPNAADAYGFTPLHYAIQKGLADVSSVEYRPSFPPPPNLPDLVQALLAHGANPNARLVKDYPAHSRAPFRQTNPISIVGATPYFLAAASGDPPLMRALVAAGADPNLALSDGTTPLMAAGGMGRVQDFAEEEEPRVLEAVKLAVELGAPINAVNRGGQTALHAAAFTGVNDVVQFLVDKGAQVNAKDRLGQTPWSIAEAMSPVINNQGSLRLHKATAELLLKLGATPITANDLISPRGLVNIRDYADEKKTESPARQ